MASAKPKNVLFIAVDDLKPILNCYGAKEAITPNIDRLAAAGTVFLNAHCQQALCGPSRVSLLTGFYPDTIGIYGMGKNSRLREKYLDIVTIPQHFLKPFFLALGFLKPHHPFVAPKMYWDPYDRDQLELAPFQDYPEGAPKCAETNYVEARTFSGVPVEGKIPEATQRELLHG